MVSQILAPPRVIRSMSSTTHSTDATTSLNTPVASLNTPVAADLNTPVAADHNTPVAADHNTPGITSYKSKLDTPASKSKMQTPAATPGPSKTPRKMRLVRKQRHKIFESGENEINEIWMIPEMERPPFQLPRIEAPKV